MKLTFNKIGRVKDNKKLLKHYGIPLVQLSKNDCKKLKEVFDFYLHFPLHSDGKVRTAHSLFSKLTSTSSKLEKRVLKIQASAKDFNSNIK